MWCQPITSGLREWWLALPSWTHLPPSIWHIPRSTRRDSRKSQKREKPCWSRNKLFALLWGAERHVLFVITPVHSVLIGAEKCDIMRTHDTARNREGTEHRIPRVFVSNSKVESMRASGASWRTIAKELGCGIGTVRRAVQRCAKNVC